MVDKVIAEKLRGISNFEQLKIFLSEEMEWPIREFKIDELTFDYDPAELGIKPEMAAKIRAIKRMRSLSVQQPWGIFFVEFENKKLPVESLRRILSHVAVTKSGKGKSSSISWKSDDLIFISNYGLENDRQLCFAHFSNDSEAVSLPVLRVISWDSSDSILHLDAVASNLQKNLKWPGENIDVDQWRDQWATAFLLKNKEVLDTARSLAKRLAELASGIRRKIVSILEIETDAGPIRGIFEEFKSAFNQNINEESFADMYAQTISYGLLAARISNPGQKSVDEIAGQIETSPLIGELVSAFLIAGGRNRSSKHRHIDFDELGVNDVVQTLNEAKMESIIRNFGDRRINEDPVVHFYEDFLNEYDPVQRIERGVFYTPRAVVRSMVEMAHETLKQDFGLEDGLADQSTWADVVKINKGMSLPDGVKGSESFVKVLDPAVGTGTFLVETIDLVESVIKAKLRLIHSNLEDQVDEWNKYVSDFLLPRINGFELMMAPYVIAHLKISLKLYETGYRFRHGERVGIYLTNALEPPYDNSFELEGIMPRLADEVLLVNRAKKKERYTVVLGNPPYSSVSQNNSIFIANEIKKYQKDDKGELKEKSKRNHLQDDYVKFIRLADIAISTTGCGVIALITNSSYLTGSWFRGMRYNLVQTFNRIEIVNLHGGKGFVRSAGDEDQNVFQIMQSVAIGIFSLNTCGAQEFRYVDVLGSRESKYQQLSSVDTLRRKAESIEPSSMNQWLFAPIDSSQGEAWGRGISLEDVFSEWGAAVKTNRNGLAVAFTPEELKNQIREFIDLSIDDTVIEEKYSFSSNYQWKTGLVRKKLSAEGFNPKLITPYLFRPFDLRFIYWHPNVVFNMRGEKMEAFRLAGNTVGILFSRTTIKDDYSNFFVTSFIPDHDCLEKTKVATLRVRGHRSSDHEMLWQNQDNYTSNLTEDVRLRFEHLNIAPDEFDQLFFHYLYGLFNSDWYRKNFFDFLKIDFPRVLVPRDVQVMRKIATYGEVLVGLHSMNSDLLGNLPSRFDKTDEFIVGKSIWIQDCIKIEVLDEGENSVTNSKIEIANVGEPIWNYKVGGSRVCEKWLKDRRNRQVTKGELDSFDRILRSIELSLEKLEELNYLIASYGDKEKVFFM